MRNLRVPRPSPAMVVASAALMVALGGGAYAQTQLARNSVGSLQLRPNAVTATKIGPNAVVSSRIRNGQVRTEDIRAANVTRERLAPNERTIWAAVNAGGGLLRSSGEITAAQRTGPGTYLLTLNRNVDQCAWVASTSSEATRNQGYAEVQRAGTGTASALTVLTSRPIAGVSALADSDFHVIIACGAPTPTPAPR